jgi:hypothetical protein
MDPAQAERLLKLITDSLEQGKDFVLEQAPDVVQQLILLKRIEYSVYVLVAVPFLAVTAAFVLRSLPRIKEEFNDMSSPPLRSFASAVLGVIAFPTTIMLFENILPVLLKVWFAPKVYLLEYLASIVK